MATIKAGRPEYWTLTRVRNKMQTALDTLMADETIITMQQLSVEAKIYKQWWKEQADRHNNPEITYLFKRIKNIVESRMINATLTGAINPTAGIFVLKSNFDMVEKQHVINENENKHSGDIKIEIIYPDKKTD